MTELSPGRWRGLQTTSTDSHRFSILAFDQRGSYKKMLPDATTYEQAADIKREIVVALSAHASAVLLDADYGMMPAAQMSKHSGLLLALEKSGYSGDSTYRKVDFDPAWTVERIKLCGGSAVKLLAYYHPDSGALAEEIEGVVADVLAESHRHGMPLFLEPYSYSNDPNVKKESAAFAAMKPRLVRETARRMSALGVDVLKLEFPCDPEFDRDDNSWRAECEGISAAVSVPWVLLSAGVDFETFAPQTRIACQAGASGFLAGRAIWKESVTLPPTDRAIFLRDVAAPRIAQLIDISEQYARPWTDFYTFPDLKAGWYSQA
jgi:tagatose-1,6-bisphosphate aldolase